MAKAKPYSGHRSWNAWNVSLWIANDEGLYRLALECIRSTNNLTSAARMFTRECGASRTPDGGVYNLTCVREALAGLE